jgi:hypothetical protein
MSGVADMIAEAEKTIGWSDQNNTVRTPVHTWYNEKFGNPDPGKYAWDWCDGWITYIAHKSGNQSAVVFGSNGHFAYTVAHAQEFKDRGQWHVDTAGIAPGDIVFFDWNGSNNISAIDHVGLVVKVEGSSVHTIEGNIENAVRRKVRDSSTIVGYGRPKYQGGTTPPPAGGGTVAQVNLAASSWTACTARRRPPRTPAGRSPSAGRETASLGRTASGAWPRSTASPRTSPAPRRDPAAARRRPRPRRPHPRPRRFPA